MNQPALSPRTVAFPHINNERHIDTQGAHRLSVSACRWSLHQVSTYRWSLAEDIEHYRAAGIPALGLWHRKIQEEGEESVVDLIAESDLGVSSISWMGGFTGTEGLSHQEAIDESLSAIQLARQLGARAVAVVGGSRGRHIMRHARRCVRSALAELAPAAAEARVTLLIQAESRPLCRPWSIFSRWEEALDMVADLNHPSVKLTVDLQRLLPHHAPQRRLDEIIGFVGQVQIPYFESAPGLSPRLSRSGTMPRDLVSVDNVSVMAFDWSSSLVTAPSDRVLALQLAGFSGYFEIEMWSEHLWQSAYAHWLPSLAHRWNASPTCAN